MKLHLVNYKNNLGIKIKRFSRNSKIQIIGEIKDTFELQKPYSEYVFGLNSRLTSEQLRVEKFKAIFEKRTFFDKLLVTKFKRNEWDFIALRYLFNGKTSLNEHEIVLKNACKMLQKMFMFSKESGVYRKLNILRGEWKRREKEKKREKLDKF